MHSTKDRAVAGEATGAFTTRAWAAGSPTSPLAPTTIRRRMPGARDVQIDILYCGVCHSDVHQVRNEWQSALPTEYPCVPGHEIVGRVARVGGAVTGFRQGDLAAVGCMVDSCRACGPCREGLEQYCEAMPTFTYNLPDKHLGGVTYGGYSKSIVVDESFVLRVPAGMNPAAAAPLLCAGITTYSPMRHWKVGRGQKVGVVGLGGLGHMAVKFAHALGAHVVLFTTSPGKVADGLRLGADQVVVSGDEAQMLKHAATFDFILDAVSARHNLNAYLDLLKRDGTMTLLGAPQEPAALGVFSLLFQRRRLAGSAIGGIRETQEMLDFCAGHGIAADIELIPIQEINAAYERLLKGDVKYRFVIDIASID
ncbi:MAG TPA: NAD(P)-dependent alcohol dehydrogenase [Candidatus Polarisedimenticolia bacterium]|nr:NAD(P)-dependent alcohol dehydrogenase [Candidatus Polarisedimenticolia bacterium]